jgi:hypothetical protein
MYRRPWPIVIFAFCQVFFEPVQNVILSARLSQLTPLLYLRALSESSDWIGAFYIIGLPIVMGLLVYAMKKWSYALFAGCVGWMLYRNFMAIDRGQVNLLASVALSLGNVAFVGYFILPRVREPYLNKRLRWWETAKRYILDNVAGEIEGDDLKLSCQVQDMSRGGVFAALSTPVSIGQTIRIRFSPNGKHIFSVRAKIVFHRKLNDGREGCGLQFMELNAASLAMISDVIEGFRQARRASRDPGGSAWNDFGSWLRLLLTTGRGLIPERSRSFARAAPLVVVSPDIAEADEKQARPEIAA